MKHSTELVIYESGQLVPLAALAPTLAMMTMNQGGVPMTLKDWWRGHYMVREPELIRSPIHLYPKAMCKLTK